MTKRHRSYHFQPESLNLGERNRPHSAEFHPKVTFPNNLAIREKASSATPCAIVNIILDSNCMSLVVWNPVVCRTISGVLTGIPRGDYSASTVYGSHIFIPEQNPHHIKWQFVCCCFCNTGSDTVTQTCDYNPTPDQQNCPINSDFFVSACSTVKSQKEDF